MDDGIPAIVVPPRSIIGKRTYDTVRSFYYGGYRDSESDNLDDIFGEDENLDK